VFGGNDLKNQNKSLSKSELRLYESLQQLDIPDWFQNSARRQQEIVILKNARSIENILSDCSFSSAEYRHKLEPTGPVTPKPVVIAHYVRMPTYENRQATKPACITKFELPSTKLRERSHSPFHPITTRSFEEIMKSRIKLQRANDEIKDEIEKSPENLVSKNEFSRELSVEKSELFSNEGIETSCGQEMLLGQNSVEKMDPESVAEMYTRSTIEELSSVAPQQRLKKDNEVQSSNSSEEKQPPRRQSIRTDSPIPCDEIPSSLALVRRNSSHDERYPPSVAETQFLRRNSLKKSSLGFNEETYPFSATQKYSVKDQISSDSEGGAMLGRAEPELISSVRDNEKQRIRTRKLTKKSHNSELLSGEQKKKKPKQKPSHLENKGVDVEDTTWQVEQQQRFEGQVGKLEEEEVPKEEKRRVKKKKRSTRTGELEEQAVREALVSDPSAGDRLDEEINELVANEQKRQQEDSRGQIKRPRRKRSEVQMETNGLQENSNQKSTSHTDIDSGFTVLDKNCLIIDDMQKVQADEYPYKGLEKAVKLKKPKHKTISEKDMEIVEFFGNEDRVMHDQVADNIETNKSLRKKKKSKEPLDLDFQNKRLQGVTSTLDLITSQEISTDESFADQLKKPKRKVKTNLQEVEKAVVKVIDIIEPSENNALEVGERVVSVDNTVRVSRKKVKSNAKKDLLDLSREQNSTDNKDFTETSSFELNESTGRTASSDFQVSLSDAQSQKPLKKVRRKRPVVENSENGGNIVHLNWEELNNSSLSTISDILTDEVRNPDERRLGHHRVVRKTKEEERIEDLHVVSAFEKPRKKLNEDDASVISDSMKVRKRLKNKVSEVASSDQLVNVSDCSTGGYSMEQVERPYVTHSRECSLSQDNLNDNQENSLSHASSVESRQPKKTKKKRVTDSVANETENSFVLTGRSQTNHSTHEVRVRPVPANQRSTPYTTDSSNLAHKARTAVTLYSPQSNQQTGYRAVDQLAEFEQQQF